MRREFLGREVDEGEVADFLAGLRLFQELQRLGFSELREICLSFVGVGSSPVAEVGERFKAGCAGRHPFATKLLERECVPGDDEQLIVPFLLPVLVGILVEQIDVFGDLRLSKHLFVLLRGCANHAGDERGGGGHVVGRERQPFGVKIVDGQVAIRVNNDGACAFFDRRGVDAVAQPFLDDDGVTKVTLGLREQVADSDGLACARHAEQHRVLRRG